jgi:hypothetical protein
VTLDLGLGAELERHIEQRVGSDGTDKAGARRWGAIDLGPLPRSDCSMCSMTDEERRACLPPLIDLRPG